MESENQEGEQIDLDKDLRNSVRVVKSAHSVAALLLPSVFRPRVCHPFIGLSGSFHSAVQEKRKKKQQNQLVWFLPRISQTKVVPPKWNEYRKTVSQITISL